MRKKYVAGNWKMNTLVAEGKSLITGINKYFREITVDENVKIVIGVPFTHIESCVQAVDRKIISIAAQNCSEFDKGAYTGEVSVSMIKGLGAEYVIVGHSERRQIFGETDELIAKKALQCYENNLIPIICCGETLEQRESGKHFEIVGNQIEKSLAQTDNHNILNTVVAYEPVWAIGTGKTASPQQAQEMHMYIRKVLSKMYSSENANNISILYGGSVKPSNASEIFAQKDIDGGLVGGASLKKDDFIQIYNTI